MSLLVHASSAMCVAVTVVALGNKRRLHKEAHQPCLTMSGPGCSKELKGHWLGAISCWFPGNSRGVYIVGHNSAAEQTEMGEERG
jgi:hypothetical protein